MPLAEAKPTLPLAEARGTLSLAEGLSQKRKTLSLAETRREENEGKQIVVSTSRDTRCLRIDSHLLDA